MTGRSRGAIVRSRFGLVLWLAVLGTAVPQARADSSPESISRYARSWTSEDGLRGSQVWTLLQDRAGYLWLGTNEGLVRFDGVDFLVWREFGGQPLPGGSVRALSQARDGAMWIGFGATGSVSRVHEGELRNYSNDDGLPGSNVLSVLEDRSGTAWAGSLVGLFRLSGDRWERVPDSDGLTADRIIALFEDRRGHLWVGTDLGIFRRKSGETTFARVSDVAGVDLSEDPTGAVWAIGSGGLVRFDEVTGITVRPEIVGTRIIADRDGTLWVGTLGGGVLHLDFAERDPLLHRYHGETVLTNDLVRAVLLDREGNIWVGTQSGLNRLSEAVVSMLGVSDSTRLFRAVTVGGDGALWVATSNGLDRVSGTATRRFGVGDGLPHASIRALHHDSRHGLLVATSAGIARIAAGRIESLPSPDLALGQISAMTTDRRGDVWVGDLAQGLVRLRDGRATVMVDAGLGRKPPFTIYGDLGGRVWAGFFDGTLVVYDGDQARSFGEREGFVGGMVTSFREDANGTLWIGSSKGLSRYRHGRFERVTWANGLPGNVIGAIAPDGLGNLWLGSSAGILRVELAELEKGFADPSHQVKHVLYDTSDGLRGDPIGFGTPTVAESRNGMLWFVTSDGVASMDIHRAAKNRLPPAVRIESVLADTRGRALDDQQPLPPRTGHLQINYAGLSLRAPEKVRFQYLMEGFDEQWVDAGTRRQAFYTNLPPGPYRFRVRAENDGVASESEAVWAFAIAPAFYQTRWFQLLLPVLGLAIATMAWRLRVRQVRSKYSLMLVERSRMAREIHDTLLQSLLGVMLRLGEVETTVDESADAAKQQIGRLRQQLEFYIREARQSIRDLRSPLLQTRDLVTALRETGERLTAGRAAFEYSASGPARRAPVKVEEHVLRIAQEAISNALRHAAPAVVSVDLVYTNDSLALRVADDGPGFDPTTIEDDGAHWGITSMRERVAQVEGEFALHSAPGQGTAIEVRVPLRVRQRGEASAPGRRLPE
jgi:signal transduction histidine kinase/ligand-binding sensor domain-containing protein